MDARREFIQTQLQVIAGRASELSVLVADEFFPNDCYAYIRSLTTQVEVELTKMVEEVSTFLTKIHGET